MKNLRMIEATCRLYTAPRALFIALTVMAAVAFYRTTSVSALGPVAKLVSINSAGTGSGDDESGLSTTNDYISPVISADGRYVAFQSRATNLVTNDTNGPGLDVFVRDLQTNTTVLVSVRSDGTGSGNGISFNPSISGDGRYVAFTSQADDLVTNDNNGSLDVFVRDLQMNTTTLVSINTMGTGSGNRASQFPVISENGQFVAFESMSSNLTNNVIGTSISNIFVRNLTAMTTTLVSLDSAGIGGGNASSAKAVISADGSIVAFQSSASNLTTNDTNGTAQDVFARDVQAGTPTRLISSNAAGTASGNNVSGGHVISKDGNVVAFLSLASNLLPSDTNQQADAYARDLQTDTLELVSVNQMGATGGGTTTQLAINADGQHIAFESQASDLVMNDFNGTFDLFVRDRVADSTELVSLNLDNTASANDKSLRPAISDDGRFVSFISIADNLVAIPKANGSYDVYVRDTTANATALVSLNSAGTATGNDASGDQFSAIPPAISADGRVVGFTSAASNLVTNDTNGHMRDVFAVSLAGGILQFDAASYSVNESAGTLTITVNRVGHSEGEVTVAYNMIDDSATAPEDYTLISGTLAFADGETSRDIVVPIVNDNIYELDETFSVKLTSPMGGALLGNLDRTVVTILNDDMLPRISINDVSVTEGNSGVVNATFTLSLTGSSALPVTVNTQTADGTAIANTDYFPSGGTIGFNPGQTTATLTVQIISDTLDEPNKTFFVNLSDPNNATILDGHGVGTIVDNDPPTTLRINDAGRTEGNTGAANAVFTVLLSSVSGQTVKVHYATANGTARAGSDYTATSGTLTIPAGETTATINVPIKGDLLDEQNETFFVNLTAPVNATIFDGQGAGTITDNDAPPRLSISNATVTEGNSGATNAAFTVQLSAASGQTVTVHFATANGTAIAPTDYIAKSGTLTFTPGQTSKVVTIQVRGDTTVELNETFKVNLSAPTNATFSDSQGIGTIINND